MPLAGVGLGLVGLTAQFSLMLVAVAASGLGVAAYHPVAARLARQVSGGSARSMSWFIAGGNLGLALAPSRRRRS